MNCCIYFFIAMFLLLTPCATAQQLSREQISERLERDGCVTLTEKNVKICKAYYLSDGNSIEALSIRPLPEGKYPGILLTQAPLTLGTMLAQQGFACLSVEQPGFGKSQGKRDFVGPATVKALITGFKKLQREPHVDSKKMGIFGYSRGAIAASLMTLRLGNEVKAAVFGAGAYDFKKAYDEVTIEGIRKNMEAETGMTEKAIRERSPVLQMKKLKSPVLILHSEKDENVSVTQALLLRDRLTSLRKDFEIKLSPTGKHGFLDGDFVSTVVEFFNRRLKGISGAHHPFGTRKLTESELKLKMTHYWPHPPPQFSFYAKPLQYPAMHTIKVRSHAREELVEFTDQVEERLKEAGAGEGVVVLYVQHTTAGLTVNENADPDVPRDMLHALRTLIPQHGMDFRHGEENSDAHIKASLVGSSVTVPFKDGKLLLGRWQGIFLCEFDGGRERQVIMMLR